MTPVIEVRDITFRYAPDLPEVLTGVSLNVEAGEFVALLGQNGAGKTTLAKHLTGLHRPISGEVRLEGQLVGKRPLKEIAATVGYCYQNPDHQIFSSSIEKEVAFGPKNLGYEQKRVEELVEHALELVGLSGFRSAHPFSLGRGQRQLLAVASIIAMDPPVLVIDEPTTGMDRRGSDNIMRLLRSWTDSGRTVLAITHDMDIVAEYIPRAVLMAGGRILADAPTPQVFADDRVLRESHLVAPGAARISNALRAQGMPWCGSLESAAAAIDTMTKEVVHARRI